MQARHHPHAAVVECRVDQRDPTGEVVLGLDVGVPVVLVPRDGLVVVRQLVDRLVPVETRPRADQIVAEIDEHGIGAESSGDVALGADVERDGERVGLGDRQPPAVELSQEVVDLAFVRLDDLAELGEAILVERALEEEVAVTVVRRGLLGGHVSEGSLVGDPFERGVPGVAFRFDRGHGVSLSEGTSAGTR
jgi:hypothetical protein